MKKIKDKTIQAQHAAFDKQRLSNLLRKAIGVRSIVEYSKLTNVNRYTIGMILNNNIESPPLKSTLYRLFDANTVDTRFSADIDEVLDAAGYVNHSEEQSAERPSLTEMVFEGRRDTSALGLSMVIKYISDSSLESVFTVKLHKDWYELELNTRDTYTGISAVCMEPSEQTQTLIRVQVLLLESMSANDRLKNLADNNYVIVTNDENVFRHCTRLPRIAARSMRAVLFDKNCSVIIRKMDIGATEDKSSKEKKSGTSVASSTD